MAGIDIQMLLDDPLSKAGKILVHEQKYTMTLEMELDLPVQNRLKIPATPKSGLPFTTHDPVLTIKTSQRLKTGSWVAKGATDFV